MTKKKEFSLFREEMKRAWRELRGPKTTPGRAAIAVALGVFVGSQPLFGTHTPVIVALCLWFQLDGALAWIASNVSNPLFAPMLLSTEVIVGRWLRTGAWVRLDEEVHRSGFVLRFAKDFLFGAPAVGLALAIAGALVTFAFVVVFPSKKAHEPYVLPSDAPPWIRAVEHVATRYAPPQSSTPQERTRFHYVRGKLLGDPIAKLIAGVAGEESGALGAVVDIGTGRGQLPILLLELGRATRARGVDWDEEKIEAAKKASSAHDGLPALDASFDREDARAFEPEPADTVLLIDLLHYFTIEEQDAILDRAARAVAPGGRILVREADTERGLRSLMTLAEERFFTLVRFNRGERVRFRSARSIAARLEAAGLEVEVRPAWGKTPFSNVLVIGRRPG